MQAITITNNIKCNFNINIKTNLKTINNYTNKKCIKKLHYIMDWVNFYTEKG